MVQDIEKIATALYAEMKGQQLEGFRKRMPETKQGVEFTHNGKTYVAAIRRLTPTECDRLQGVPEWYNWGGISDTQHYKMVGNGWQIDTIRHCWSFLPKFNRPIRVWSLFDGMSCGHVVLNQLNISLECYISSEIDKFALQAEKQNFPDMVQVGSVVDMNVAELVEKYGVPDFIFGGSPCFASETKVLTSIGYKNIKDVKVGDMVLTHKNRYKKVLRIGNKVAQTYKLHAQGFIDVVCTENHPFYARKKNQEPHILESGRISSHIVLGEPEWVEAKNLAKKYYIANNIEVQGDENPFALTEDECWVIGRYIADGHTRKDLRFDKHHKGSRAWQLILSVGDKKVEQFCSHIKELHYSCYKHGNGVHRIVFSNKRLVELAEKECGVGSINKMFGESIIRLPKHLLEIVLKSYIEGDGYVVGERHRIITISPMLGLTLQRVVSKLYKKHICIHKQVPKEFRMLCGRLVHQNPQYAIEFCDHDLHTQERPKVIEDKIWYNVKSFVEDRIQIVYNIEVEEDNSYTANNIIVHNCQDFSMSGKRRGMTTNSKEEVYTLDHYLELKAQGFDFVGQSYLFWEYMRVLTELREYNPDILFFLENVKMLEKWERCLSHAIGIRGVHINSALVSAQQRKRIYWSNIRTKEVGDGQLFHDDTDPFSWPNLQTDIPQPQDKGIVIKDVLEDEASEKMYLKDDAVCQLIDKTDKGKLRDYLLEPQVSVEEALSYMATNAKYSAFTEQEKQEIATLGYELEKKRLSDAYHANETAEQ